MALHSLENDPIQERSHSSMTMAINPDKIVGIVNTKDLFFLFSTSGAVLLEDALYPATFLDPGESVANA